MNAVHLGIARASAAASGHVAHSKIASETTTIAAARSALRSRLIAPRSVEPGIELAGEHRHRAAAEDDAIAGDAHPHDAAARRGLEARQFAPAEARAPVGREAAVRRAGDRVLVDADA